MCNKIMRFLKSIFAEKETKKPHIVNKKKSHIVNKKKPLISLAGITTYHEDWFAYALEITGGFEGSGYNQISGNFDGQGISVGVFQWNYGQGSLQREILKPAVEKMGEDWVNSFFPSRIAGTHNINGKAGIAFAKSTMLKNNKTFKPLWKKCWQNFMTTTELIVIQQEASREFANKAWGYCKAYKLKSARAFAFFFDVVVQNGSMKGIGLSNNQLGDGLIHFQWVHEDGGKNKGTWLGMNTTPEMRALFVLICLRARKNKWRADVIARKGTIAHGKGNVHRENINLEHYFITK